MENRMQSDMRMIPRVSGLLEGSVPAQNSILHRAFYLSRCKNHSFIKEANGVLRK
jgi:hypothetical protein